MKLLKMFILLVVFIGVPGMASLVTAQDIRIAVASDKPDKSAAVSEVAGRADYILFFDAKGEFVEAVENPNARAAGGAGKDTAAFLSEKGATVFIAGKIGDRMLNVLNREKIESIEQTGAAHEVVKAYLQNR